MMREFEKMNHKDANRLAILESLAVEFEQRLLTVMHPEGNANPNVAVRSSQLARAYDVGSKISVHLMAAD